MWLPIFIPLLIRTHTIDFLLDGHLYKYVRRPTGLKKNLRKINFQYVIIYAIYDNISFIESIIELKGKIQAFFS